MLIRSYVCHQKAHDSLFQISVPRKCAKVDYIFQWEKQGIYEFNIKYVQETKSQK